MGGRMVSGLYVALVTPFDDKERLHEEKLRELVEFHVEAGTDGLVPCGTTGETPALTAQEHLRAVQVVVEQARGRVKVIAGAGTNSTAGTVANLKRLADTGIDGALVITPYYNKPTQAGLLAHFRRVAAESPVPVTLYNVPGRTGVNLLPETVMQLAGEARLVAIKEASGSVEQASWILHGCGRQLQVLSGEDALNFPLMAIGASGTISVLGNIVPKDVLAMIAALRSGDLAQARRWHYRLLPLCRALFLETNPVPVKEALNLLGFEVGRPRLPLVSMQPERREELERVLAEYSVARGASSAPAAAVDSSGSRGGIG
jgi:4-hydroxy-tetrahydrodipicolinate synthase